MECFCNDSVLLYCRFVANVCVVFYEDVCMLFGHGDTVLCEQCFVCRWKSIV